MSMPILLAGLLTLAVAALIVAPLRSVGSWSPAGRTEASNPVDAAFADEVEAWLDSRYCHYCGAARATRDMRLMCDQCGQLGEVESPF